MKYLPLTGTEGDRTELEAEYRTGKSCGVIRLGEQHLFFKKLLSVYYIPYGDITRYFRRVEAVPAKIGCCSGEMQVENVVICGGDRELAQIQLPGKKAALFLMEELARLAPEASVGCPPREDVS